MSWDERIISEEELMPYLADPNNVCFSAQIDALIKHQKETWPMLAEGYAAFAAIETKRIEFDDSFVVVQHNPMRARSTGAPVDKASVAARNCFLCEESLPAQEKGIAYGYLTLVCNPFPVLDRHLSIVHRGHLEQKISGNVETMLALAAALAPDYFVLYNGPQCGASAPDHFHFQACSRALLPIVNTVRAGDPEAHCSACEETSSKGLEVFTVTDAGRSVIVFRSGEVDELTPWIYAALAELPVAQSGVEPMVNLICTYDRRQWTVYLFPRARHRPASFFAEGSERLLVSPGAIDMAGVIVVPEREHFDRIGAEQVRAIFSEVSLSEDEVNNITGRVCAGMGGEEVQ